jgi:protocatechuate 3,4-dioxygenase beta subunit
MKRFIYPTIQLSFWVTCYGLFCVTGSWAQTTPAAQKMGSASVSGRITLDEKPASGVVVGLLKADVVETEDMIPVIRVTTDSEGRYRMTGVLAGRFRLQAMAPGFVTEEQKRDLFSGGNTLNLNEGEVLENQDFKLTKGAVITGKVTDTSGRPLIAARLQLFQVQANGRKQPAQTGSNYLMMQTDDRGTYRLYGLLAGKYIVGASPNAPGQPQLNYHPNTTSQDEAKVVEVDVGSENRNIDIRLSNERRKTFSVQARVVDVETGQPVSNVSVGYRVVRTNEPGPGMPLSSAAGMSDTRGNVRLDNLSPGRYSLGIANSFRREGQNVDYYSDLTPFEITDDNLEGVEIRAHRGITVSGIAVVEGIIDPALTANLFAKIGVDGASAITSGKTPGGIMYPSYFKINSDGSFQVRGLMPGLLSFSFNQRSAAGFMLVRVEAGNLTDGGQVNLVAGQSLTGVRLILAYGTAVIRGQTLVINGSLPPGARMNVNLRRADVVGGNSRFAAVDARGLFVLEGVPAGEYEITLTSVVRNTVTTVGADGKTVTTVNTSSQPLSARQRVIVPAVGEVPVTVTLDIAAQQNAQKNPLKE